MKTPILQTPVWSDISWRPTKLMCHIPQASHKLPWANTSLVCSKHFLLAVSIVTTIKTNSTSVQKVAASRRRRRKVSLCGEPLRDEVVQTVSSGGKRNPIALWWVSSTALGDRSVPLLQPCWAGRNGRGHSLLRVVIICSCRSSRVGFAAGWPSWLYSTGFWAGGTGFVLPNNCLEEVRAAWLGVRLWLLVLSALLWEGWESCPCPALLWMRFLEATCLWRQLWNSGDRSQILQWLFQRLRVTFSFQPHLPALSSKQSRSALQMVLLAGAAVALMLLFCDRTRALWTPEPIRRDLFLWMSWLALISFNYASTIVFPGFTFTLTGLW